MAFLPLPVTMMMCSMPDATHSSATYWMRGLSTTGSISLGCALVAGRKRVPRPAAGKTALRTRPIINSDANTRGRGGHAILAVSQRGEVLDLRWAVDHWDSILDMLKFRGQSIDDLSEVAGES